jgi:hypothetical protein
VACGNNMVLKASLQAAPAPLGHPSPGRVDNAARQQAVAAAERADNQVAHARQAVNRASTETAVKTALRDAEQALKAARRAGGDKAAKDRLRSVERQVEQLRREASEKQKVISGREHLERENRARFAAASRDNLSRMSLGVVRRPGQERDLPSGVGTGLLPERTNASGPVVRPASLEIDLDPALPLDPLHLSPDTAYRANGILWQTDSEGHVCHVEAELRLDPAERHLPHQVATGRRGDRTDDGGHLIASRFGGFGSGPNIVPQARDLNRSWGQWYKMEDTWAEHLANGDRVVVAIDLAGDAERPEAFVVRYTINGTPYEVSFINEDFAEGV